MNRTRVVVLFLLLSSTVAHAEEEFPRVPPTSPEDAVKTFSIRDGFQMQLLASEPLVTDPVAMEYDEQGRAFVAEMRDYPYTHKESDKPFVERTHDEPLGRIRLLEDTDGDGRFDKSTIFAEGLSWPTGLALWKGGVFVVATPDLWYLKDTDGDGRADERRKVLTGFRKFNVQAVVNNLKWGLDGRIYGAGSSNGGQIRRAELSESKPIPMATADFRFDPRDEFGSFELLSGGARFGNAFDDWGRRFICNIRNPIQQVVLPRHYLARNSHLTVRSPLNDVAESGDTIPVFRTSPPEPWRVANARRLANDATLASPRSETVATGYMTSASGLTVYRGAAYPASYLGNVFLGEVAGNLIHHQVLTPRGVTFTSKRSEEGREFLSSTDNWFRPVNFVNAPDGTLHVLDMYRETIEHPWSIPDDIKARLDLESGRDRGRIYRLAPVGFQPPRPPRLGEATMNELVRQFENPNSWWRETAQRLLLERQDLAAVPMLRKRLLDTSPRVVSDRDVAALARLHSLWTLSGLRSLTDEDLLAAFDDPQAEIVVQAVQIAEPRLASSQPLRDKLLHELAGRSDDWVRMQVAFSLGTLAQPKNGPVEDAVVFALSRIADRDADSEWTRVAVLSSSSDVAPRVLRATLGAKVFGLRPEHRQLIQELARLIGARGKPDELEQLFDTVEWWAKPFEKSNTPWPPLNELTLGLGDGLKRANQSLSVVLAKSQHSGALRLRRLLESSLAVLADSRTEPKSRQDAMALLTFVEFAAARETLLSMLQPRQPAEMQAAAVKVLSSHREATVPKLLLANYRQLGAAARGEVVEALLSRPEWHAELLAAIDAGQIKPAEIPHVRRNVLVRSANAAIKERSVAMFRSLIESRQAVVNKYRDALPRLVSDRTKGEAIFRRECQACHRLNNQGTDVGPNLATIRHRAPEEVLLHILDPNREVAPNFVAYAVTLDDGRVLTGLVVEESASSLTLVRPTGARETILRANVEEISATGLSLMPPGLEERVSPQDMADLLAYLLGRSDR